MTTPNTELAVSFLLAVRKWRIEKAQADLKDKPLDVSTPALSDKWVVKVGKA